MTTLSGLAAFFIYLKRYFYDSNRLDCDCRNPGHGLLPVKRYETRLVLFTAGLFLCCIAMKSDGSA